MDPNADRHSHASRVEENSPPKVPRMELPRAGHTLVARLLNSALTAYNLADMSRHMPERTTVRLPEGLLDRAKRKAARERRTLTSLIEEGLRLVLAENRKTPKGKRVLPRISTATGGQMPGLDLTDFSSLQEIDDLEYVERMKHFK